jgi:hypothetical protein
VARGARGHTFLAELPLPVARICRVNNKKAAHVVVGYGR